MNLRSSKTSHFGLSRCSRKFRRLFMSRAVKLVLYIVCIAGTCVFGRFFLKSYKDATTTAETKKESVETAASTTATEVANVSTRGFSRMVTWGLTMLLPILGLAVLIAHDVSHFFGSRAEQALKCDTSCAIRDG